MQPKPNRRLPLVAMLVGAVALLALATVLFQQFGGDDQGDDPSDEAAVGPGASALTGSPAAATAGTANASPMAGSPVSASECWSSGPATSAGGLPQWSEAPKQVIDPAKSYTATIETTAGPIVVDLKQEMAPITVNNFVCLASAGYYDNTPFHRIILDFMIQGGDPTGTGTGGPGYQFQDELPQGEAPYVRGTLAMANSGPNTNGSQFFIVHRDQPAEFPTNYSIFGQVAQGLDIVDALAAMPVVADGRGELSDPTGDVRIVKVTITEQ